MLSPVPLKDLGLTSVVVHTIRTSESKPLWHSCALCPSPADRTVRFHKSPHGRAALAPVVTPEQLMASMDDLDAELNPGAGLNTPPTFHHPVSPGLSPPHLLPLLAQHEPPWDEYGGSAASGLDLGMAGSASDEPNSAP